MTPIPVGSICHRSRPATRRIGCIGGKHSLALAKAQIVHGLDSHLDKECCCSNIDFHSYDTRRRRILT